MTGEGHKLTITVDLSKEFVPSAYGKTILIASTEGSVSVPDREEKVGLNVLGRSEVGPFHTRPPRQCSRDMDMQSWLEKAEAELQSLA
jgi:hypothetical protein